MQTIPVHVFMCLCSDRIKISQEMEFQSLLLAETSAGRYSTAADLVSPCFFFPWYFKQSNWPVGTDYCGAPWEPSFAQASIYKSLNLSATHHIFKAIKAVQIQATPLIRFQILHFITMEIQLEIEPLKSIQRRADSDSRIRLPLCSALWTSSQKNWSNSADSLQSDYLLDNLMKVFKWWTGLTSSPCSCPCVSAGQQDPSAGP